MSEQLTIPGVKSDRKDKQHADRAAKQRAYRERRDLQAITVQLPRELNARLDAWLTVKGKAKSATIAHLIETQLLRKR